MNGGSILLIATLALPLAMLSACLLSRLRARMLDLLWLAPVPGLLAALLAQRGEPMVLPQALYGASLALDTPGALLLGAAALLWIATGVYASVYFRGNPDGGSIAPWWLLVMIGNFGVFIAADIASFYLFFAMASLAACGLVIFDGTARARRAGAVYIGLALLGEVCVLMGLMLLAATAPGGSLLIRDAVAALPGSPWRDATLALLITGFGLKIGLVPFHVWMPLAYSAAPLPAAAVLSGAAVKTGVMGLIQFLPFEVAQPLLGEALTGAGFISAFYGVAIGITQANPKTVLAYSSVSQMGLVAAVIGMGLAAADDSAPLAASFYGAHHVLVKGALFLALGVAAAVATRGSWPVLLPAAIIGLGLAGLPLTGGALAKLAVKAPLGDGVVGNLAALSAAGTTLLMLHFLRRLAATVPQNASEPAPAGSTLPWLAVASASFAVPWAIFAMLFPGTEPFSLYDFWSALWPVLIGALVAFGLWRWPQRLPQVPEGDVVVVLDGAARATTACGVAFESTDDWLRQWAVAGVSLLAVTTLLGVAIAAGH